MTKSRNAAIGPFSIGTLAMAVVFGVGLGATLAPAANLVGYWSLNEGAGSGTDVHDTSGNLLPTGTLGGSDAHTAASLFGLSAVDLNGTDQYISLSSSLDHVRDLIAGTISFWVNLDTLSPGNRLFGSTAGNVNDFWRIAGNGASGSMNLLMKNGGADIIRADAPDGVLTTGAWQHIAYTSSAAGNTLYVDGSALTLTYTSGDTTTQGFFEQIDGAGSDLSNLSFGRLYANHTGVDGYTDGRMDDISIWDDALSAAEIATLYNSGAGTPVSTFDRLSFNIVTPDEARGTDTFVEFDSRFPSSPDANHSADSNIAVKASDDPDYNGEPEQLYRKGYLRFDLSAYNGETYTAARLELTPTNDAGSSGQLFRVYAIDDAGTGDNDQDLGGYDPSAIDWNNAPANDNIDNDNDILAGATLLGTFTGGDKDTTVLFDDDALLSALNADLDGMITLIITSDDVSSNFTSTPYTFASVNAGPEIGPRLVLSIVPEPATFALLGFGLLALAHRRR